jgi:hypothetical protein
MMSRGSRSSHPNNAARITCRGSTDGVYDKAPGRSFRTLRARYLVHDRDSAFEAWATTARAIGIDEVITAAHSPWQNAYAERLIGSIRRKCLDHIIVANERGLRRVLHAYVDYYLKSRTHLALGKNAPVSATRRAACQRRDRRDSPPRWPPPPLRTPRRVTRERSPTGHEVSGTAQRLRACHLFVVSRQRPTCHVPRRFHNFATVSPAVGTAPSEPPDGVFSSYRTRCRRT